MKLSFLQFLGAFAFLGSAHAVIQGTLVNDIPATAGASGVFTTLLAALRAAGLRQALSVPNGPFTVFAPPDTSFAALPAGLVDCLLLPQNKGALTSILTYHVVSGSVTSGQLGSGPVTTLQGEAVQIDTSNGVTINGSTQVVTADVSAFNGVIHIIDSVLVPPSIDVVAFMATCPAPNTAVTPPAPAPAPAPGQQIQGKVIIGQPGAPRPGVSNGVSPPAPAPAPAPGQPIQGKVIVGQPGTLPAEVALVNIPQTAVNNGFDTLVAAVGAAGLDGALAGAGPFTVFAPTEAAFTGLPDGLVSCLLLPANVGVLTALLQFHVVSGKVESGDLTNGAVPSLLNGANITVDLQNGVQIKGANTVTVTTADVQATNGVIHVIDGVLVPPAPFDLAAFIATCPPPPAPMGTAPAPAPAPGSSNSMRMRKHRHTEEKKNAKNGNNPNHLRNRRL